ncbi:hypothetical protein M422DRAFT_77316, partial [Sphaerobolus stellatus SS14]
PDASRSPCPALNTLANHGYLPRDGHAITLKKLADSLTKGFGLSYGFALYMAVGTFLLLRRPGWRSFDLADTYRHGFIEHNASLSRDDCPYQSELGSREINPERVQEFLDKAAPTSTSNGRHMLTINEIASHRIELERRCAPLSSQTKQQARIEFAMVMELFGEGEDREVMKEDVETLIKEERLPDEWKPKRKMGHWNAIAQSQKIRDAM